MLEIIVGTVVGTIALIMWIWGFWWHNNRSLIFLEPSNPLLPLNKPPSLPLSLSLVPSLPAPLYKNRDICAPQSSSPTWSLPFQTYEDIENYWAVHFGQWKKELSDCLSDLRIRKLGVEEKLLSIRKRYKQLAQVIHPDRCIPSLRSRATDYFKELGSTLSEFLTAIEQFKKESRAYAFSDPIISEYRELRNLIEEIWAILERVEENLRIMRKDFPELRKRIAQFVEDQRIAHQEWQDKLQAATDSVNQKIRDMEPKIDQCIQEAIDQRMPEIEKEIDHQIGSCVQKAIENQIGSCVQKAIENQIGSCVQKAIENQIGSCVQQSVKHQIGPLNKNFQAFIGLVMQQLPSQAIPAPEEEDEGVIKEELGELTMSPTTSSSSSSGAETRISSGVDLLEESDEESDHQQIPTF